MVNSLEPIKHFTVPTPSIGKEVLPSPNITFPVAGSREVKNSRSRNI
jgi:hypothetical protein